ncbi:MAG: ComEC/Rec2 family competence protein [Sulfurospirillaceae bacterium]|nr:ComEC/Rec2 family competence protein [Sulfurospirillaceae bacterium]
MESVPLFTNKKEIFVTFMVLLILFCFSLGFEYIKYKDLVRKPFYTTQAKVLNHYQKSSKKSKPYDVFKLRSEEGFTFYTISWKHRNISTGDSVTIKFRTKHIKFVEYMKSFFTRYIFLSKATKQHDSYLDRIKSYVRNQHKTFETKEIFSALFFSSAISKKSREKIQKLGISHLIAISGFHLGLLSLILFFLFTPVYRLFQDRYFPYRNIKADLSVIVFFFLFLYMYVIDFSPSFLRSFVMAVFGFFLFSRHIKIVSFLTLLLSICFILVLFPKLIFSISFWFSVSGVFYIFLFLKHFSNFNKILIFILLNFWVYLAMLPIVHFVFPVFTPLQLASPLLSMLFTVFYPVELFAHLMNFGGLFDSGIEYLLNLKTNFYEIMTPIWFLIPYLLLSLLGIFYRWLAVLSISLSFGIFLI